MLTPNQLDKLWESDELNDALDNLYHNFKEDISVEGYILRKVADETIYYREGWDNQLIFQIAGDDRLWQALQPCNSWEGYSWCSDEPILEVIAVQKVVTSYEPVSHAL